MKFNQASQEINQIPFDPHNLTEYLRIKPVQFAKICGVSKNAVSLWIKHGKITLLPDGTLNPTKAASELIKNSDAKKLRTKLFKPLIDDVEGYKVTINQLNTDIKAALDRELHLRQEIKIRNSALDSLAEDQINYESRFISNLIDSQSRFIEAINSGLLPEYLEAIAEQTYDQIYPSDEEPQDNES